MAAKQFAKLFKRSRGVVIGMVHVKALPGTPTHCATIKQASEVALKETEVYAECGLDGIIIENMHDLPYLCGDNIGPEIVASMSAIASKVKMKFPELPTGIQILKAGNKQSVAVAHAAGCEFVRVECFTYSHVSDAGWINATAGELLRYRKQINADDVALFTDIKKKHSSHSITSDLNTTESGIAAEFFLSEGLVVTGQSTGHSASQKELKDLQCAVQAPVLVGSGVTVENLADFINAEGLIVGSHFKHGGVWKNDLDSTKVKRFMERAVELRRS